MPDSINSKADSKVEGENFKKILRILARANGPAHVDYISLHSEIKQPITILRKMEERGLVSQSPCSEWSSCLSPMFEITLKARREFAL